MRRFGAAGELGKDFCQRYGELFQRVTEAAEKDKSVWKAFAEELGKLAVERKFPGFRYMPA